LVTEKAEKGEQLYICECGLGYDDAHAAYACDQYCRTHGVASGEIVKKAVRESTLINQ
jgi:hypothetical protein